MAGQVPDIDERVQEWAGAHNLKCEATLAPGLKAQRDAVGFVKGSRSYLVTLVAYGNGPEWRKRGIFELRDIPFHMGPALKGGPQAADVLECLVSDASSIEGSGTFESWAEDFGMDPDSRTAEQTWRQILEQAHRLRGFLGRDFDYVVKGER
jgi:hypothetical protein